jgi:hypothetical protein
MCEVGAPFACVVLVFDLQIDFSICFPKQSQEIKRKELVVALTTIIRRVICDPRFKSGI